MGSVYSACIHNMEVTKTTLRTHVAEWRFFPLLPNTCVCEKRSKCIPEQKSVLYREMLCWLCLYKVYNLNKNSVLTMRILLMKSFAACSINTEPHWLYFHPQIKFSLFHAEDKVIGLLFAPDKRNTIVSIIQSTPSLYSLQG